MEKLLPQLGEMLLGALPTVLIVFALYFFLRWSFFTPLERVLAERERLTAGSAAPAVPPYRATTVVADACLAT